MADLSTDSTGPAPILATDPDVISGAPSDQRFSERVKKFFDSLLPTGSTAYDTGWVDVTLASGYTSSPQLQVRRKGFDISWRGRINRTAGNFTAASATDVTAAGAVPSWARPTNSFADTASTTNNGSNATAYIAVSTAGTLSLTAIQAGNNFFAKPLTGYTVN